MEIYPPSAWMDQCKALVRHDEVWALLQEWSWLESWDTGFSPVKSVHCALLDVLAPEVGALYASPSSAPCCDWCGVILPGCTPDSHTCEDTPHQCSSSHALAPRGGAHK